MKVGRRRRIGIASGLLVSVAVVLWLDADGHEHLHAAGPMNTQHGDVACESCHRRAPGTVRQQFQNAARSWVGLSASEVDIGYRKVSNEQCLSCHERPDDRHPVFRFLEPRFAEVRELIHPEQCSSCHLEHRGKRVTRADITYCRHCHGDLVMKQDPLDVPHRELVATERWDSCLGCHDFHGNHGMKSPHRVEDAIPAEQIRAYFAGGASPYPPPIRRATQPEEKSR
ncbi:MAG: cytochrome c3 family protein [Kofleriaceae bacterium]